MRFTLQIKGKFWLRPWLVAFAALALASPALGAAPTIQIPRIETAPSLSAFEDMQPSVGVAGKMIKVTGFIVREPADGATPTQTTDVYLAYDEHNLYAGWLSLLQGISLATFVLAWMLEARTVREGLRRLIVNDTSTL